MENIVEDPRYEGLDVTDRAKVGGNVSSACVFVELQLNTIILHKKIGSRKNENI